MSYPPRPADRFPGFFLGDFLSPASAKDFSSDPSLFAELEKEVGPYRPWATVIHDGGNEAAVLDDLQDFLEQHLRTVSFLMNRCDWDLFMFDLMATDRIQHELWHVWDLTHRVAQGREKELAALRPRLIDFWQAVDRGVGAIEADLPSDTALLLMSDHGFGPIEHYVNFNVWLLERGDIALEDSFYVRQKHWCYRHGVTPEWIYGIMSRLGLGSHRVSRFRGKQSSLLDRAGESMFLSRRHIDWSRTRAYAQGNFGQIFLNVKGRQPQGCVAPEDVRPLLDDLKAGLKTIPHPETGEPLVEHVYERDELYHGPHAHLAPDLTVVLDRLAVPDDRPARLHDAQGDLAGLRADRRSPDGRGPGGLGAGVPHRGDAPQRRAARHRPDRAPPAGRPGPRRHGRPRPGRDPRPGALAGRPARPRLGDGREARARPRHVLRGRATPSTPPRKTPRSSAGSRSWATSERWSRSIGESGPRGRGPLGSSGGPWRNWRGFEAQLFTSLAGQVEQMPIPGNRLEIHFFRVALAPDRIPGIVDPRFRTTR